MHGDEFYNHMLIINYFPSVYRASIGSQGLLGTPPKIKGRFPCSWSRGLVPRPVNI